MSQLEDGGELPMEAGAMEIGGANKIPKKIENFMENIDDMDHRQLYHKILDFSPAEWEAVREAAHQLMGGSASPMWGEIEGGAMMIGGADPDGVTYGDLKDVLLTPSRGAAGRLLELEADAKGSGFKKALKKSVKHAKKLLKTGHKGLKHASAISEQIGEMGGPIGDYAKQFNQAINPALQTANQIEAASKVASNTNWKDTLKNPENIKTAVDLGNAALMGNFKETAKAKVQSALAKPDGGELQEKGGEEIAGELEQGGAQNIAGELEQGSGMPIAGEMEEIKEGDLKPKKKGGKVKKREIKKKKPDKAPEALPLEKASANMQQPLMVDMHKGKRMHDPRRHR